MVEHGQGMLWFFSAKSRHITLTIIFFTFMVWGNYLAYRTNFIFACKFKHTRGEVPHCSANSLLPIVVQCWILIVQVTVS